MIYSKIIDNNTISATTSTSNSNYFISFTYEEFLNVDLSNNTYESRNTISGFCNLSELSWSTAINSTTGTYEYVKLNMGGSAFIFTDEEYYDFNGDKFDIAQIITTITSALGI